VCDVQDRLRRIFDALLLTLGGRVATYVEGLASNVDLLAVGFVDDAINELEAVGVGNDFVSSDEVLCRYMLAYILGEWMVERKMLDGWWGRDGDYHRSGMR